MKSLSALKFFLPVLIVIFAFTSCDMNENPVGTFEEAVQSVPEVRLIEGADNATINVKYDRNYSYFSVDVSNVGFLEDISDGVYSAWCIQMEQPLSTNQDHHGTRLYNTISDKTFNKLSYIVNNRRAYERDLQGLSWKDIQVAMWVILETSDLKLATLADKIPSSVDGYNRNNVNSILSDVQSNGNNFTPGFGDIKLVMANASGNEQDVGLEIRCETAMARMIDLPEDRSFDLGMANWFTVLVTEPSDDIEKFYLYAAQWYRVGEVDIWRDEDSLYVDIILDTGYEMEESHVHVESGVEYENGEPKAPEFDLPNNNAFGQYLSTVEHDPETTQYKHSFAWDDEWDDKELYIAVHAVVCGEYPVED